jgi:hypothetical protein
VCLKARLEYGENTADLFTDGPIVKVKKKKNFFGSVDFASVVCSIL